MQPFAFGGPATLSSGNQKIKASGFASHAFGWFAIIEQFGVN